MYADRDRYVADPAVIDVPVAGLLDPVYIQSRAALIGTSIAGQPPRAGQPPGAGATAPITRLSLVGPRIWSLSMRPATCCR